jgi:long-chain acyl-CoA synthetase
MSAHPWLAWYDPGVPVGIVVPDSTLPDLLTAAAREYPAAPAILFYGRVIDYATFDRLATRFAVALRNAGVAPGERVALVLPNIPQAPVAYYGALRAGAIVVLTNPIFEAGGLVRQLTDAGATTLVALSMFHPLVMAVRERASVHRVIYTNLKEFLPPGQRRLFTLLRQEREGHRVPTDEARRALWMAHMLAETAAAPLPSCDPDEPAAILYTGGTTGEAKGVVHTHRSLVANALQVAAWLPAARRGAERVVCVLPFSHAYGMTACMNFSVAIAAAMILLPTFETAHVLHAIRRERATIFPGVPPMYAAIAEMNNARRYGLSSLRACISGAAPLPIEVQEGFERVTRARLVEGYGLTEAGPVTHANPLGSAHERHATIGIPLPSTDAKIVDATTGADLPPGRIGELLVRGPQVMQGSGTARTIPQMPSRRMDGCAQATWRGWTPTVSFRSSNAKRMLSSPDRTTSTRATSKKCSISTPKCWKPRLPAFRDPRDARICAPLLSCGKENTPLPTKLSSFSASA